MDHDHDAYCTPGNRQIQDATWIVSCARCDFWRTLGGAGGFRIAASAGKRTLGWCSQCRWFRMMRVQQARQIPHDQLMRMLDAADRA